MCAFIEISMVVSIAGTLMSIMGLLAVDLSHSIKSLQHPIPRRELIDVKPLFTNQVGQIAPFSPHLCKFSPLLLFRGRPRSHSSGQIELELIDPVTK